MKVAFLRNLHFYIRIVNTARFSAQKVPKNAVNVAANSTVVERSPSHHVYLPINILIAVLGICFFEVKVFLVSHHLRTFQSHVSFSSREGTLQILTGVDLIISQRVRLPHVISVRKRDLRDHLATSPHVGG